MQAHLSSDPLDHGHGTSGGVLLCQASLDPWIPLGCRVGPPSVRQCILGTLKALGSWSCSLSSFDVVASCTVHFHWWLVHVSVHSHEHQKPPFPNRTSHTTIISFMVVGGFNVVADGCKTPFLTVYCSDKNMLVQ